MTRVERLSPDAFQLTKLAAWHKSEAASYRKIRQSAFADDLSMPARRALTRNANFHQAAYDLLRRIAARAAIVDQNERT